MAPLFCAQFSRSRHKNWIDRPFSVGDHIVNHWRGITYEIVRTLGEGRFGQVFLCRTETGAPPVALKIGSSRHAEVVQGCIEGDALERLNSKLDSSSGEDHIVRMLDRFVCEKRVCIALELLDYSLRDALKRIGYKGIQLASVSPITGQLLKALSRLHASGLVHSDVKPENVMIKSSSPLVIKLIDFNNTFDLMPRELPSCSPAFRHSPPTVNNISWEYAQSRFYRSPEVLLGLPFASAVDVWSACCVCVELFLGMALFPGQSAYYMVRRIFRLLGPFPSHMLEEGSCANQFFHKIKVAEDPLADVKQVEAGYPQACSSAGQTSIHWAWEFKTNQEHALFMGTEPAEEKLPQWPFKSLQQLTARVKDEEARQRFVEFLQGLLQLSPQDRWTASRALEHPFMSDATAKT
eukprot:TRINITY_DN31460_c0_g1_i1.p1 TRINITY_DN31460_c0_g1~~TRINITY_DN31460_c0_g1_i1.p1  ORF type:complete len:417 (-),score=49.28 TRINITY_DN31460_c0_g1_i1:200-1423(-)